MVLLRHTLGSLHYVYYLVSSYYYLAHKECPSPGIQVMCGAQAPHARLTSLCVLAGYSLLDMWLKLFLCMEHNECPSPGNQVMCGAQAPHARRTQLCLSNYSLAI